MFESVKVPVSVSVREPVPLMIPDRVAETAVTTSIVADPLRVKGRSVVVNPVLNCSVPVPMVTVVPAEPKLSLVIRSVPPLIIVPPP